MLTVNEESIERSREAILNDAVGFTQLTHSNYINEIAASENSLRSKRDQLSDHCKELDLCKPLSKDLLKFQDTNRTFEIPLGERMDGFRDRIAKTEQKLARLWKEWELIQNQILSFGEEVLGSQGVDVIGSTMAGLLNEETEKLSQDLAMDKAKCAEEIEAMYEEAIRKMRDNEKVVTIVLDGVSDANTPLGIGNCHERAAKGIYSKLTSGHLRFLLTTYCHLLATFAISLLDRYQFSSIP